MIREFSRTELDEFLATIEPPRDFDEDMAQHWVEITLEEMCHEWHFAEGLTKLDEHTRKHCLRMGLILAGQMDAFLKWTRSDQFTPGRLHKIPRNVEMVDELIAEMQRVCVAAYSDGVFSTAGKHRRSDPAASLSKKALKTVLLHGARLGAAALHGIRTTLMPVLESVWSPDGTRLKSQAELEREIRTVYAAMIGPAPKRYVDDILELAESEQDAIIDRLIDSVFIADLWEFETADPVDRARDQIIDRVIRPAKRRMKVRNREQYEQWQKTKLPYSKWIKQSAAQLKAESVAPPTLNPQFALRWVQTERTRFQALGVFEATRNDPYVVGYRYTVQIGTHPVCVSLASDGVIRKNDPRIQTYTPPLHHGCTGSWQPVMAWDEDEFTLLKQLPDPAQISKGFGQAYPAREQARVLVGGKR